MAGDRSSKRPHEASSGSVGYDPQNIVTVYVGPDEHRFAVHQDVVCAKSRFFEAACSKRWLKNREKIIRLPDTEPNDFKAYVDYVYTETLVLEDDPENPANSNVLSMYLLGDEIDDVQLRNKVVKYLWTRVATDKRHLYAIEVCRIWENTPATSFLRKWTVDTSIQGLSRKYLMKHTERYPVDLVLQIATGLVRRLPPDRNWIQRPMVEYEEPESIG